MGFLVGKFMLFSVGSKGGDMFLEVCLRKKDAAAVGTFVVVVVVCLRHGCRLMYVYVYFFAV